MKEIYNRRSIRKYKDRPIEKEKIEELLRAAMQAPSASDQQSWEFIVVENKKTLGKLSLMNSYSKFVADSAATIVILGNSNKFKVATSWEGDMGAATENILLEATYLELGSVWLGIATDDAATDYIKKTFDLPENIKPFALVSVGYPDNEKNEFIDRFDEKKIHYEDYK
ncbi:nitroreductase family protein [Clostridium akagii]|uniref:nitroreductase family protein n=1 Tax=Clostridium akagii TaxID=91623 RepID=UPI00047D5E80|nr:nitroreductase family protein [Clostridium akagii]